MTEKNQKILGFVLLGIVLVAVIIVVLVCGTDVQPYGMGG